MWPLNLTTTIISLHKTLQLMIMFHLFKVGCKRIKKSVDTLETVILIGSIFTVIFTLKTANQSFRMILWRLIRSFYKTLRPTMMYHQTKFGCKKISGSEDTVETVVFWNPHCDLDLEVSTQIFQHDTPAHDDSPSYKAWLQKVQRFTSGDTVRSKFRQTDTVFPI